MHDHSPTPTVYVYLTDSGPVRFRHIEEHAFTATRAPLNAGMFRISPGRLERHEVENLGDIPSEFLRVELKQVPLGFRRREVRSARTFDLTHSVTTTEFNGPPVRVERIIAAAHETLQVEKSNDPSLLIAFTPTSIVKAGEVKWIKPREGAAITGVGTVPAHVLRIIF